jgi:predicted CopG family antitoxin
MKTITIREETYDGLSAIKEPGESFSDVIDSLLLRKKADMKKFFGILRDSKVLDEIEAFSQESRNNTRTRI